MLAANAQRFQRIWRDYRERPGGDYGELLRRGAVSSPEGADAEVWRATIRRQARQDKLSVLTRRDGERAVALLNRTTTNQEGGLLAREVARINVLDELERQSRALGHKPIGWLRHDDESITACQRCGARIYLRLAAQRVEDGEGLTDPCAM